LIGKILLKKWISAFLSDSGLLSVFSYFHLKNSAFVLVYHRVLCPDNSPDIYVQPGMYVSDKSFESQVAFLKKKYQIIFLDEMIEKIKNNDKLGGFCSITFDDGWVDNYTNAFPILKKFQACATIYLATDYIGAQKLFWPEEICLHLERECLTREKIPINFPHVLMFYNDIKKHISLKKDSYLNKVIEVMKGYLPYERNNILEYFREMGDFSYHSSQMLSWEEVDEMKKSGLIKFGAHTAGHEILDQLPISVARDEILKSKKAIEQKLGVKVTSFAYPNGNYNENIKKVLQENDFSGAVTNQKGYLIRGTSLMEIPRISIHEDISNTVPMFIGRILLEKF
jgi:peptidoglycan/xylan/chitin deacetylase (PgdA/CDA1 family)